MSTLFSRPISLTAKYYEYTADGEQTIKKTSCFRKV